MKDTEQLQLEYLRIKNERDLHLFDEKRAHKNVTECEEKMRLLERDIKAVEEENKLNECIDTIRNYCIGMPCKNCAFYSGKEDMAVPCKLMSIHPAHWKNIK